MYVPKASDESHAVSWGLGKQRSLIFQHFPPSHSALYHPVIRSSARGIPELIDRITLSTHSAHYLSEAQCCCLMGVVAGGKGTVSEELQPGPERWGYL